MDTIVVKKVDFIFETISGWVAGGVVAHQQLLLPYLLYLHRADRLSHLITNAPNPVSADGHAHLGVLELLSSLSATRCCCSHRRPMKSGRLLRDACGWVPSASGSVALHQYWIPWGVVATSLRLKPNVTGCHLAIVLVNSCTEHQRYTRLFPPISAGWVRAIGHGVACCEKQNPTRHCRFYGCPK